MYKTKTDIKATRNTIIVLVLMALTLCVFLLPTKQHSKIQTLMTVEIYRAYTVQRTNSAISAIYLDTKVYTYRNCAEIVANDDGHTCAIYDALAIAKELALIGYDG